MKKEVINEATCFTLEQADQLKARDEFFRRMAKVPEGNPKDLLIYSKVAAEIFKEIFPKIAEAIEAMRDEPEMKKRPVFIKGFRFGHIREFAFDYVKEDKPCSAHAKKLKSKHKKYDKALQHSSEPESILLLAVCGLLSSPGFHLGLSEGYMNFSSGDSEDMHNHENEYAIVTGLHGVDDVKTNIWYRSSDNYMLYDDQEFREELLRADPNPDFAAEMKRGSLLIIPPGFDHSVDGFEAGRKRTNQGKRATGAIFPDSGGKVGVTDKELSEGREKYVLPSRPLSR